MFISAALLTHFVANYEIPGLTNNRLIIIEYPPGAIQHKGTSALRCELEETRVQSAEPLSTYVLIELRLETGQLPGQIYPHLVKGRKRQCKQN